MISHPAFQRVDPWAVHEVGLDLSVLPQSESIFALSNGHLGMRANLDEGEPHGMPGTYLNGFYETQPLPYAETGFGYPETADALVNVTNGKIIRLLVGDEPFDVRYGRLDSHRRTLDLKTGVLTRDATWTSPAGTTVRVRSSRLVSFVERAVAAIRYEVEPVDKGARVVLQSELVANETLPASSRDPRASTYHRAALRSEFAAHGDARAVLVHSVANAGLRMAAAMGHRVQGPANTFTTSESDPDLGRITVTADLRRHQPLVLTKFLSYGWSSTRSLPALRDQAEGALAEGMRTGFPGLVRLQTKYLSEFWHCADVEIEGDPEVQQGVRFALFHVLQASARAEERPIPAKGLTGPGYDGHTFWDMETFLLHALTYLRPDLVPSALRWRHSTLPLARERARILGLEGAAFPWRTIRGAECSGYWPAGTAAFHVNADIADAVTRYCDATEDTSFEQAYGFDLLVETARLWRSLGCFDSRGGFRIDGVTGPNEYHAVTDNNLYTNLMAQHNFRGAVEVVRRHRARAQASPVRPAEVAEWAKAADAIVVPFDPTLGVHSESEGFTDHERWDFEATKPEEYPLLLHFPYFHLYRKQVVKQADTVLAMHLRGEAFTAEQKRKGFEYYEGLTVRDSSLSASTQAVIAAETGHIGLAYDYLAEAALIDLEDIDHNVQDGVHTASLAGSWLAVVAGLGGMRAGHGRLQFAPRLPSAIPHLSFGLTYRGRVIRVDVDRHRALYRLLSGPPLEFSHYQRAATMDRKGTALGIPALKPRPAPRQPKGREPRHRGPPGRGASTRAEKRTPI